MRNSTELDALIGQLNAYLLELDNDDDFAFEEAVSGFMQGILQLLSMYYSYQSTPAYQGFIAASAAQLEPVVLEVVDSYLYRLEDFLRLTWYEDHWFQVVEARSAVAALLLLYGETNLATHFKEIGIEETDDIIRNKGATEGHLSAADIPFFIPRDHWWWWFPRSPYS